MALGIAAVTVQQDERDTLISLREAFEDPNSPDSALTFPIPFNTNPALFSRTAITADGTLILDYAPGQSGRATITVFAIDPGGLFTETSFDVTVIPTGPFAVTETAFVYQSPPHRLRVTFNRDVDGATLAPGDLTFVIVGPQDPPEFSASAVTYDPATRTATFTLPPAGQQFLDNGNYRATLASGSVSDTSGNALAAASVTDFYVLIGDINRDRAVNGTDFAILAGNFGKTGMTYAQGDLNGDGSVNGSDFALLAGNFGRTVPAPAALVAPAVASAVAVAKSGAPTAAPRVRRAAPLRAKPLRAARAGRPMRPPGDVAPTE